MIFQPATVARVQRASALVFLLFLSLHLVNTALAVAGPAAYDRFQSVARILYQHPLLEWLLIFLPLTVHAACGVWRLRHGSTPKTPARRAHRYAGILLLVVVGLHILATRGPSLAFDVFLDFHGVAYTFEWAPYWFYPYYGLFALAAIIHRSYGLSTMWTRGRPRRSRASLSPWLLPGAAFAIIVLALLGFGGVLYEVEGAAASDYGRMEEFIQ